MRMFQKNLMASEDVQSFLGSGVFYDGGNTAAIHDGAAVVIGDLEDHAVYSGIKDINVRKITASSAATDVVAIVDYTNRSEGDIMGNTYREGVQTAGLEAPAGKVVRYRILAKHDSFYLATGNFVGQFTRIPRVTICGIFDPFEKTLTFGVARCSVKDTFVKAIGRDLAYKRAITEPYKVVSVPDNEKISKVKGNKYERQRN